MKKRVIATLLTLFLLVGTGVPALASKSGFSDVPTGYWAEDEIRAAAGKGILQGFGDGTFRPGQSVTYAQFAVMLARAFYPAEAKGYEAEGSPAPWYYPGAAALRDHGVLRGTAMEEDAASLELRCAGSFVTRYDMAQMAYNIMLDYEQTGSDVERGVVFQRVRDWDRIPGSYRDAVTACYVLKVLEGQAGGSFGGDSLMTRAQGCVVIERLGKGLGVETGKGTYMTFPPSGATLLSGDPVTEENVRALLLRVAEEWQGDKATAYPAGNSSSEVKSALWSYTDANGRLLSMTQGPGGYAALLSDRIFGRHSFPIRKLEDITEMRAGDIVVTLEDGHAVQVSTYSGTKGDMMTLDGRTVTGYGMIYLKSGGTAGNVVITPEDDGVPNRTYEVWTRYPE